MDSDSDTARAVGCPIRRSRDQRLLASPPGLSQRATSFIASQCQGIHQMPFISRLSTTPNGKDQICIAAELVTADAANSLLEDTYPDTARRARRQTSRPGNGVAERARPRSRTTRFFTFSINQPATAQQH